MAVEFPDELTVTCDECGDEDCEASTTEFAGSPPSIGVDSDGLPEGWTFDGGQLYYCPKCSEERGE